jgi:hypothetical protein
MPKNYHFQEYWWPPRLVPFWIKTSMVYGIQGKASSSSTGQISGSLPADREIVVVSLKYYVHHSYRLDKNTNFFFDK